MMASPPARQRLKGFGGGASVSVARRLERARRARDVLLGLIGLAVWQNLEVRRARQPVSFA